MSLPDAIAIMLDWQPIHAAGISRKVRNGVTGWQRWLCIQCGAETLKGYHAEIQHEPDCPWVAGVAATRAALEAAEAFLTMSFDRMFEVDYSGAGKPNQCRVCFAQGSPYEPLSALQHAPDCRFALLAAALRGDEPA